MARKPAQKRAPKATVNETLRDRGVAHAVYLERLKTNEGQIVLKELDENVLPDLTAKLDARLKRIDARGIDIEPAATKRLQEMLEVMQETVDAWSTGLAKQLADSADRTADAEATWQDNLFSEVVPVKLDFVIPPTATLAAAVVSSPIDGALLSTIVDRLGASSRAQVERAIRLGIAEGESIDRITSRIKAATDFMRSTAEAVARTAIGHAANIGRSVYYAANADFLKAVGWVATLDTRTCLRCMDLDGKTFPLDSGPRPPRHILCRCTTFPILKSMRELGLNINDFDPATRASMDGQVPGSITYGEWLKRQPAAVQVEALGATRAALFQTGDLSVGEFVDRGGDPYDLDELRKREADAFKAARL